MELPLVEVAPVNRAVLEGALEGKHDDFEEGVVSEAAHHVGARAIVTRNVRHYKDSVVPAYLPAEILEMLMAGNESNRGQT